MNLRLLLPASLIALLAAGCPDDEPANKPPAADAGVQTDAGLIPDAGEQDAGLPLPARTLLPARLLGDSSIENRVQVPHFDPYSDLWYGFSNNDLFDLWRLDLPATPSRLPALEVRPSTATRFVVGFVRGGPAPLVASVWIGRDVGAAPDPSMKLVLYGLGESATKDIAFDLAPVEGSEQELEKILWRRYEARISEELLGVGNLVFSDSGSGTAYLNAPSLVVETEAQRMPSKTPPRIAQARKPTAEESKAVRRALEEIRKRPPRLPPDPADGIARQRR
ncbi:MAG: hypothetical protein ACOX6T_20530 [Myxococcales bacterium]|jgi:hypothetical protein